MTALFLKDLAEKNRRSFSGRLYGGTSAGGRFSLFVLMSNFVVNGEAKRARAL